MHGEIAFPIYLPDATFGVVRGVDADDLANCGVKALMMNTFHLMQRPGATIVQALGGLHKMSSWFKPIFTDSGGFQAYSLIRQQPGSGSISNRGLLFRPQGSNRKLQLSPEKSIQLQMSFGSDVIICLDDCTHVDESESEQEMAVARTIEWARRGKAEFLRLAEEKNLPEDRRPRLFAVVQGGKSPLLRRRCAEALLEIGFDGFGYGGWPLDGDGNLLVDVLAYVRQLLPERFPLHALGVGHPRNVLAGYHLGYDLFDSAMPTRDARHGRLYILTQPAENAGAGLSGDWFAHLYINDEIHVRADAPLSPYCDCLCCRRYSRGYLHHLFKLNDSLFLRLATLHNLRFMVQLTERIRIRQP